MPIIPQNTEPKQDALKKLYRCINNTESGRLIQIKNRMDRYGRTISLTFEFDHEDPIEISVDSDMEHEEFFIGIRIVDQRDPSLEIVDASNAYEEQ